MRESWEALGVVETEWHRRLKSPFTTVVVRNNKPGRMNEKKSLAKKLSSFFYLVCLSLWRVCSGVSVGKWVQK